MTNFNQLDEIVSHRRGLPPPSLRRAVREAAGLSQDQIARALPTPVRRETVCRWESGLRSPRGAHLIEYVDVLRHLQAVSGMTR